MAQHAMAMGGPEAGGAAGGAGAAVAGAAVAGAAVAGAAAAVAVAAVGAVEGLAARMTSSHPPDAGERPRTVRVPWEPFAAAAIRRALVADLEGRDIGPQTVGEAEIVVSELVANALRHARPLADGMIRVHWKVKSGVVEVEVSDGGGGSVPRPAPSALWSSSGRGLRIVRSLAHEWGVTEERSGRTVWAALGGPSRRRTP